MKITNYIAFVFLISLLLFAACNSQPEFTIKGTVKDASDSLLYLEKRGLTKIETIDSIKIKSDGSFKLNGAAPQYPDMYLLRLGNQTINLSVDSTETISIEASAKDFSTNYKVEGSLETRKMKDIVLFQGKLAKELNDLKGQYQNKLITDTDYLERLQEAITVYKDTVKRIIIGNPKSPAAYFALFQKIDNHLIFDPYEKNDSKMYGAVATSWEQHYMNNPRTKHLREFTLRSMKERISAEKRANIVENAQTESASEYYTIELPDIHGNKISTSSLKGKIVLLDFTAYQAEYSPAHNIILNKLYNTYKNYMEIYQVSFDGDLHFWQNAALNLPWICVRDEASLTSPLIRKFNLQQLPTIYLMNSQGEIVKRISEGDNIENEIKKLL